MEIRDRCDRMLRRVRPSVREVFAYCEACVIAFPDSVKSTVFWVTIILHHEVCFQHVPVIRQETSVITTRMTRSDIRHHKFTRSKRHTDVRHDRTDTNHSSGPKPYTAQQHPPRHRTINPNKRARTVRGQARGAAPPSSGASETREHAHACIGSTAVTSDPMYGRPKRGLRTTCGVLQERDMMT